MTDRIPIHVVSGLWNRDKDTIAIVWVVFVVGILVEKERWEVRIGSTKKNSRKKEEEKGEKEKKKKTY